MYGVRTKYKNSWKDVKKINIYFNKISSRMRSAGFDRSTEQCRLKVNKLRAEYKKIRDGNKKTGEDRKDWKHFDALDAILGSKPSTEPLIVVDTLAGHCDDVQPFTVEDEGEDGEESDEVIVGETEMLGTSQSSISTANLDCVEDEKVDVRNIGKNKGKKRMSRDDRLENAMDSVMTKMMERQSKTDELFLELETKRMKMEEQMYEMEQRRVKEERERQERERREEREFQLKLYSMICGTNHLCTTVNYSLLPIIQLLHINSVPTYNQTLLLHPSLTHSNPATRLRALHYFPSLVQAHRPLLTKVFQPMPVIHLIMLIMKVKIRKNRSAYM